MKTKHVLLFCAAGLLIASGFAPERIVYERQFYIWLFDAAFACAVGFIWALLLED